MRSLDLIGCHERVLRVHEASRAVLEGAVTLEESHLLGALVIEDLSRVILSLHGIHLCILMLLVHRRTILQVGELPGDFIARMVSQGVSVIRLRVDRELLLHAVVDNAGADSRLCLPKKTFGLLLDFLDRYLRRV